MEKGLESIGKTVWLQDGIVVQQVKIVGWDEDRFVIREDGYFGHGYRSVSRVYESKLEAQKVRDEYAEKMYAVNIR